MHHEPLAARIRPHTLKQFVGQEHLVAPGKPFFVAVKEKHLFSFILWGPPGVGKTTLAKIYAHAFNARFFELSAVSAGKDDIRAIVEAPDTMFDQRPKVLFLDEIHRFNKVQQDYLLPFVESGALTLIGATTENPSFEVISALLSRCRVFVLQPLSEKHLKTILMRTKIRIPKDAMAWLTTMADGDARVALTVLESTQGLYGRVSVETLKETLQHTFIRFDKKGEQHYDTVSAFIKSMRAGDADAALYYLARMLEGGEDPKFIARRMVIFASEDVGLAQPTALVVANEVFRAVETIGLPEAGINLAHGVAYLSLAKKDRSAYDAFRAAQADVKEYGNVPIPLTIRNAPTKLMKKLGYGDGYTYYDTKSHLPDALQGKVYLSRKSTEKKKKEEPPNDR